MGIDGMREVVWFGDASIIGFEIGVFKQEFQAEGSLWKLVGFIRNHEGEILQAIYSSEKGVLLRVFND